MPRVPAHSDRVYDEADYPSRSSERPFRVSGWAIHTDPHANAVLVSLSVCEGEGRESVALFLTLPAAHQIGKALRQAVKDCLNGEATE